MRILERRHKESLKRVDINTFRSRLISNSRRKSDYFTLAAHAAYLHALISVVKNETPGAAWSGREITGSQAYQFLLILTRKTPDSALNFINLLLIFQGPISTGLKQTNCTDRDMLTI